ncbi:uncharacterized oxidoreductase TM_0325-like [Rhipicephalus sanguineus]|uniref:uncharacterized oxidoreductase TM_0325-like n=1 Tax=Rhipicephalus sanguineus TaxID=34632 RepID=UPI001894B1DF|nr:uncharacterized oxidoreductase TM_0325-like [Rhipicephalus sanguineus]
MPDIKGKVAIIIGASAGIGESTAKHFASLGCWLTLFARNADNLEKAAEACCALGLPRDKVLVVPGDITFSKDCENVVQKTVNHFGKIDILVNNAGILVRGSLQSASLEDFDKAWKTNFRGPLCLMKNAIPYLRQTKEPYIAYIQDVLALCRKIDKDMPEEDKIPLLPAHLVYDPSSSFDFRRKPQFKSSSRHSHQYPMGLATYSNDKHALGRIGTPEEVARSIAFLASDDAAFVTGITMPVDGGLLLLSSISNAPKILDAQKAA